MLPETKDKNIRRALDAQLTILFMLWSEQYVMCPFSHSFNLDKFVVPKKTQKGATLKSKEYLGGFCISFTICTEFKLFLISSDKTFHSQLFSAFTKKDSKFYVTFLLCIIFDKTNSDTRAVLEFSYEYNITQGISHA